MKAYTYFATHPTEYSNKRGLILMFATHPTEYLKNEGLQSPMGIPYGDMSLPGCVGDVGWDSGERSSGAIRYTPSRENEGKYEGKPT